ncbi:conserved hypothetical protein [Thermosinus carboxydivorans Nor1]|uniref:Transcriptional modulator of MazE/toxin, MazF n=1 Tax=Thermosinus carboxydivorans Nor1 TaxID=401526 RepID=A1HMB2_9FIRM|nr:type II toxin-antitoxin system PemK/MazF family toxin [Thermosinus carboxydivorans]EAX49046.1 conserved hypothetical protein [Thermosinus carboxydivorans Nor1]
MGRFVKGDVTQAKRRPALVVASLKGDDLILCQITSQNVSDDYAIAFADQDMRDGKLNRSSNIRPNRLFTADHNIILYRIGSLTRSKMREVVGRIINIIKSEK